MSRPSYADRRDSIPPESPAPAEAVRTFNHGGVAGYGGRVPYQPSAQKKVSIDTSENMTTPPSTSGNYSSINTPGGVDRDPVTPLGAPYAGVPQERSPQGSEVDDAKIKSKEEELQRQRQAAALQEIKKSVADLVAQQKQQQAAAASSQSTRGGRCGSKGDRNFLVRIYCKLGRFPVLGPIMQCLLLLNLCCVVVLALPLSLREAHLYPVLTQVGLVIGSFFYPLMHVLEQVSPPVHSFDLWFQGYLPVPVITGLKQAFP